MSVSRRVFFVSLTFKRVVLPALSDQSAFDWMHIIRDKQRPLFRHDGRLKRIKDQDSDCDETDRPFAFSRHERLADYKASNDLWGACD